MVGVYDGHYYLSFSKWIDLMPIYKEKHFVNIVLGSLPKGNHGARPKL